MKKLLLGISAALVFSASALAQSATVFSDDFNRASLNGGSYTYTTTAGGDGGASIVSNTLVLTNDSSGTANTAGRTSLAVPLSSFSSPFSTTLSSNAAAVTWNFNMQQIRSDPSGFDGSGYGAAFVLAGTDSNFMDGSGYAVLFGQSGSTDPVRLVRYSGGLDANANITNIITSTSVTTDVGADYLSLRVTYDPATSTWSMFARNDGLSAFTSPTTGTLNSVAASAINSTHTSLTMGFMGAMWNYSTGASQVARFDNVSVAMAIPEPSTYAAIFGALALAGVVVHRRRQARR